MTPLKDLLALAENATPGPYTVHRAKYPDNTGGYDYAVENSERHIVAEFYQNVDWAQNKSFPGSLPYHSLPASTNADFYAAANPAQIIAMCKALELAREALTECAKSRSLYGMKASTALAAINAIGGE